MLFNYWSTGSVKSLQFSALYRSNDRISFDKIECCGGAEGPLAGHGPTQKNSEHWHTYYSHLRFRPTESRLLVVLSHVSMVYLLWKK